MELSCLRAEDARLRMECEIPKKATVYFAKNVLKYAWIDAQGKAYLLPAICATLAVRASGYQAWKRGGAPNLKRLADAQMLALPSCDTHSLGQLNPGRFYGVKSTIA